jgi:simple sugar transport system substrate-binding protein
LLVAGVLTAAAGCGGGGTDGGGTATAVAQAPGAGGKKVHVTVIGCPSADPFCGAVKKGSEQAASQLGVDLEFLAPTNTDDFQGSLVKLMEQAISRKPDAIVLPNLFPSSQDQQIKQATAAGIPVVSFLNGLTNWKENGSLVYIGEDPALSGQVAGQRMAAAGAKNGLCINHIPGSPDLEKRCAGFAQALKAAGGKATTINVTFSDSSNPTAVQQTIKGALASHKDTDAVFTLGSSVATNAAQAVQSAGLAGKVKVGTTDLSNQVLEDVKSGKIEFALDQQPWLVGYTAVQFASQAVTYGMHPVAPVTTGPLVISKDNADQVLKVNKEFSGFRGAA